MYEVFVEFINEKTKDKKSVHIVLIYVVYAVVVFAVAFSSLNFVTSMITIGIAYLLMATVIVPFTAWYKVYYKEDKSK